MNKCINKRLGDRLFAYEAGMLSGPELEEMELHLLECKYCNDRAQAFRSESEIIRRDPEIRDVIARLAWSQDAPAWYRSRLVRTVFATAAVLALLLLRPWQLEFRPTQVAVAGDNRLVVFPFDNLADPADSARLGDVITNLIITDVSGCPAFQVVSDQRRQDIARRLDAQPEPSSDAERASQVARETHSRWILSGSVVQITPVLAVTSQLSDAATGDVLAAHRLEGTAGQSIFSLTDSLTAMIRADLALPELSEGCVDLPVSEVTTQSPEAYRCYLDGIDLYSKYYLREATDSFLKAVEYDSTFAMAFYYLARLKSRTYLEPALRFAGHATAKERLYIESLEASARGDIDGTIAKLQAIVTQYPDEKQAWYDLGRYAFGQSRREDAVRLCRRALDLDPMYKLPYNTLAYVYSELGKVDSALWAIDTYIRLAPDEPNPYDTRGDICADNGRLEDAIASYTRTVDIRRDFNAYATMIKLGDMLVLKGDYVRAREIFQEIAVSDLKAARSRGRTGLALLPLQRGKLDSALLVLDDGIAADRLEQATSGAQGDCAAKHYLKASVYREQGRLDSALACVRAAIAVHNQAFPNDLYSYRYFLAQALAERGKIDSAREVATALKGYLETNKLDLSGYWYAEGCIKTAEGRPDQAAAAFEQSVQEFDAFYSQYLWGEALLASGQFDAAVRVLEVQLGRYPASRRNMPIWSVRSHYLLGTAYEGLRRPEQAIEQYRLFLNIWAEADPDLTALQDARARLSRLTAVP